MFPLKPLECCFSSMLRVIVLLEGEPLSQSEISRRLKPVSLKNFHVFSAMHHSFNSDQFLSPCWWKTSTQHDTTTTMLHRRDGARFPSRLGIQAKEFHQTRESCFSWSESPLGAFWQTWCVVLLEGSPISTKELLSSVRVTFGFLVTSLTKPLLPRLFSLAGRPAVGRVLVVPNFSPDRVMEASLTKPLLPWPNDGGLCVLGDLLLFLIF